MADLTDPRLPKGTTVSDGIGIGGEPVVVVKHPHGRHYLSLVHTEAEATALGELYLRMALELRRKREGQG